eukprot:Plantae.Rhodophyta-Hildenbrandia_rubra.ctg29386.p1 GENE.Plantae.Rhodophyta-Hildenbrandia_rubra.ctg29386~~Plantae.Rhodophyta-Hildenbrandia_rubra.ctg29386.p1  ORF type:complete len:587 (-),score=124.53 Plantae.Rhodophyta-Hildenbrandia_rubra.ctg29386:1333-3093(-)
MILRIRAKLLFVRRQCAATHTRSFASRAKSQNRGNPAAKLKATNKTSLAPGPAKSTGRRRPKRDKAKVVKAKKVRGSASVKQSDEDSVEVAKEAEDKEIEDTNMEDDEVSGKTPGEESSGELSDIVGSDKTAGVLDSGQTASKKHYEWVVEGEEQSLAFDSEQMNNARLVEYGWPAYRVRGAVFQTWRGLNRRLNKRKVRLSAGQVHKLNEFRSEVLERAIKVYLEQGNVVGGISSIKEAVSLWDYCVSEDVGVLVVRGVVAEAKKRKLELFGGVGVELAVETVEKMVEEWGFKDVGRNILTTLVRIAREDSNKKSVNFVMTVLRWADKLDVRLTWDLMKDCFDVCTEGLDLGKAAILMTTMRERKLLGSGSTRAQRECELYKAILKVSVKNELDDVTEALFQEMGQRGIDLQDADIRSSMAAYWTRSGKEELGRQTMETLREDGKYPSDLAYAAMMKVEGSRGNTKGVTFLLEEAEEKWSKQEGNGSLHEEVVRAAFNGYRAAMAGPLAIQVLERLTSKYKGYVPTEDIYKVVIETCWRSNMLDAGVKLRREMQKHRRRSTKLTVDQKRKLKKEDNVEDGEKGKM